MTSSHLRNLPHGWRCVTADRLDPLVERPTGDTHTTDLSQWQGLTHDHTTGAALLPGSLYCIDVPAPAPCIAVGERISALPAFAVNSWLHQRPVRARPCRISQGHWSHLYSSCMVKDMADHATHPTLRQRPGELEGFNLRVNPSLQEAARKRAEHFGVSKTVYIAHLIARDTGESVPGLPDLNEEHPI